MEWHVYGRLGMLIGLRDRIDAQGPGVLQVYEDPAPATLGAQPSVPPLIEVPLPVPCATIAPSGPLATDLAVMTLIVPNSVFVMAAGQVGWAQVLSADGSTVIRGRAGLATDDPTPDFIVTDRLVFVGGEVSVTGTFVL